MASPALSPASRRGPTSTSTPLALLTPFVSLVSLAQGRRSKPDVSTDGKLGDEFTVTKRRKLADSSDSVKKTANESTFVEDVRKLTDKSMKLSSKILTRSMYKESLHESERKSTDKKTKKNTNVSTESKRIEKTKDGSVDASNCTSLSKRSFVKRKLYSIASDYTDSESIKTNETSFLNNSAKKNVCNVYGASKRSANAESRSSSRTRNGRIKECLRKINDANKKYFDNNERIDFAALETVPKEKNSQCIQKLLERINGNNGRNKEIYAKNISVRLDDNGKNECNDSVNSDISAEKSIFILDDGEIINKKRDKLKSKRKTVINKLKRVSHADSKNIPDSNKKRTSRKSNVLKKQSEDTLFKKPSQHNSVKKKVYKTSSNTVSKANEKRTSLSDKENKGVIVKNKENNRTSSQTSPNLRTKQFSGKTLSSSSNMPCVVDRSSRLNMKENSNNKRHTADIDLQKGLKLHSFDKDFCRNIISPANSECAMHHNYKSNRSDSRIFYPYKNSNIRYVPMINENRKTRKNIQNNSNAQRLRLDTKPYSGSSNTFKYSHLQNDSRYIIDDCFYFKKNSNSNMQMNLPAITYDNKRQSQMAEYCNSIVPYGMSYRDSTILFNNEVCSKNDITFKAPSNLSTCRSITNASNNLHSFKIPSIPLRKNSRIRNENQWRDISRGSSCSMFPKQNYVETLQVNEIVKRRSICQYYKKSLLHEQPDLETNMSMLQATAFSQSRQPSLFGCVSRNNNAQISVKSNQENIRSHSNDEMSRNMLCQRTNFSEIGILENKRINNILNSKNIRLYDSNDLTSDLNKNRNILHAVKNVQHVSTSSELFNKYRYENENIKQSHRQDCAPHKNFLSNGISNIQSKNYHHSPTKDMRKESRSPPFSNSSPENNTVVSLAVSPILKSSGNRKRLKDIGTQKHQSQITTRFVGNNMNCEEQNVFGGHTQENMLEHKKTYSNTDTSSTLSKENHMSFKSNFLEMNKRQTDRIIEPEVLIPNKNIAESQSSAKNVLECNDSLDDSWITVEKNSNSYSPWRRAV